MEEGSSPRRKALVDQESFELKNAQRLLIDQNVFENNWADAQNGFAILFTPRGEDGVAPWATVQDVTFTNNVVRHSGGGFNIAGPDDSSPSQPSQRILIKNNLIDDIDGDKWGSAPTGRPTAGSRNSSEARQHHFRSQHDLSKRLAHFRRRRAEPGIRLSQQHRAEQSLRRTGQRSQPGPGLAWILLGYDFKKNVIVGVPPGTIYPADNFLPPFLVWWDLSIWPEEITALRRPALIKRPAATARHRVRRRAEPRVGKNRGQTGSTARVSKRLTDETAVCPRARYC